MAESSKKPPKAPYLADAATTPEGAAETATPKKKKKFFDTWTVFILMILLILVLRFLVFEPFKIPSGSMEPTLIGHEDYGDRIVTNKLAYKWSEPKRFDVVVFVQDSTWGDVGEFHSVSLKRNFIKRLVGLPGDKLGLCGGDLFKIGGSADEPTYEIIRKWKEAGPEVQETLWIPVARPTFKELAVPEVAADAAPLEQLKALVPQDENRAAFPWDATGEGSAKRTQDEKSKQWGLDVNGAVTLTYGYPVTNMYVKMGRWPFQHINCPWSTLSTQGPDGVVFRAANAKSPYIRPFLPNSWSGIRCPNCGRLRFPVGRELIKNEAPPAQADIVASSAAGSVKLLVTSVEVPRLEVTKLKVKVESGYVRAGDKLDSQAEGAPFVRAVTRTSTGEGSTDELSTEEEGLIEIWGRLAKAPVEGQSIEFRVLPDDATPYLYGETPEKLEPGCTVQKDHPARPPRDMAVGDLKVEMEFEVLASGGGLALEVGSTLHRTGWAVPLGGAAPEMAPDPSRHDLDAAPALAPGKHMLMVSYVDGTAFASVDGDAHWVKELPVQPIFDKRRTSLAKVQFSAGTKVRITRMDLYRDNYWCTELDSRPQPSTRRDLCLLNTEEQRPAMISFRVPKFDPNLPVDAKMNFDGFWMMGDNSPNSTDSRVWGPVPRDNLVGRASVIWWPPSRWRVIH